MTKFSEEQRVLIARQANSYDAKFSSSYGHERKNEPCCYGKLVKFLMFKRGFSYQSFAERIGITPQALNHRLNIQKKKNYKQDEIEKYCEILFFDKEEFLKISEIICSMEAVGK